MTITTTSRIGTTALNLVGVLVQKMVGTFTTVCPAGCRLMFPAGSNFTNRSDNDSACVFGTVKDGFGIGLAVGLGLGNVGGFGLVLGINFGFGLSVGTGRAVFLPPFWAVIIN